MIGKGKNNINKSRRTFLISLTSLMGAVGAAFAAVPFIGSWFPSARARAAGAPVTVDLSHLEPGEMMTVAWRGKPIWIIRRTSKMLDQLAQHSDLLRDPKPRVDQQPGFALNIYRSLKPEYLIITGICINICACVHM